MSDNIKKIAELADFAYETEEVRKAMIDTDQPQHDLWFNDGPTWDTEALKKDFEVIGFAAPFVVVRRKSDGKKGSLEFTHSPRIYFGWQED